MADGNGKPGRSKWIFDLDIKEFTENALKAHASVEKVGEAKNLSGLVTKLMNVSKLVGVVGTAVLAMKASFDLVSEGEQIRKINDQFDILTKNAGLSGEAIKSKLVGAAGGLADDTDILKAANEQVVRLGANSKKLPEIMELARKSTAVIS